MSTEDTSGPRIVIEETPGDIRNCKVVVDCPKRWDELRPLTDRTRHCSVCDEAVFLCQTDAELAEAVRLNYCVAVHPESEFNYEWSSDFVGLLEPPDYETD